MMTPPLGSRAVRRFEASDARADEGRRVVMVGPDRVVIARGIGGIFMRIALPPRAYRGVLLRIASLDETGFLYEVRLAHADAELGVELARCRDRADAEAAWRRWARYFGAPRLVERVEGVFEPAGAAIGEVAAESAAPRRRGRGWGARRARFLMRRKVGRPELCVKLQTHGELSTTGDEYGAR